MGTHLNPGNAGFAGIVSDEYVDKTGLITLVDRVIGTPRKLVCVTRPRRFGKTFAAAGGARTVDNAQDRISERITQKRYANGAVPYCSWAYATTSRPKNADV